MNKHAIQAAALLLFSSSPLSVSAEPDKLPVIVITASRTVQTVEQTLASVTVIDRKDIENQQAHSVADLLRKVQGLSISNNGGPGKATSIFMRGTESDHLLVLIDGVKVGSATSGSTPFQDIPLDQIERIEIVRGPRSSLYGSEAIGGVIQIFTRKGGGQLRPLLSLGVGSYGTYRGYAALTGGGERGWFNVGISHTTTEGFNACSGQPGVAGCRTLEPDEDGYQNISGNLRLGYRFKKGVEVDAHWLRSEGSSEYDGGYTNENETVQQVIGSSFRLSPMPFWDLALRIGRSQNESDNLKDDLFKSRFNTVRDTASMQNDFLFAEGHLLTLGVDYQQDQIESSTAYPVDSRDNWGVFGQYQALFGLHNLQVSLRRDDNEQFDHYTTGSLAWGYEMGMGLRVTAAYGTAFKAPTFNELYYPGYGNSELNPEQSTSIEVGLRSSGEWGQWSINAYQTEIDDLIAYDASLFKPANISSAHIRGLEGVLNLQLFGWAVNTNITLLEPKNRASGSNRNNLLPRRSEQSLHLDLSRGFGPFNLGASFIAEGQRYDDLANTRELDAYTTLDLRADYLFAKDWRLQSRIENLFDEDYETASYYNQPGRSLFITLHYQP